MKLLWLRVEAWTQERDPWLFWKSLNAAPIVNKDTPEDEQAKT